MLCADCQLRPVIFRRTRCLECAAGRPMRESRLTQYRPEDHADKRERLREMVMAAIRAGEIVTVKQA